MPVKVIDSDWDDIFGAPNFGTDDTVARGIRYLRKTQSTDGLWPQDHYTGGGFPRVFYLRYHGYAAIFPLQALARYRDLKASNTKTVRYGM